LIAIVAKQIKFKNTPLTSPVAIVFKNRHRKVYRSKSVSKTRRIR